MLGQHVRHRFALPHMLAQFLLLACRTDMFSIRRGLRPLLNSKHVCSTCTCRVRRSLRSLLTRHVFCSERTTSLFASDYAYFVGSAEESAEGAEQRTPFSPSGLGACLGACGEQVPRTPRSGRDKPSLPHSSHQATILFCSTPHTFLRSSGTYASLGTCRCDACSSGPH